MSVSILSDREKHGASSLLFSYGSQGEEQYNKKPNQIKGAGEQKRVQI